MKEPNFVKITSLKYFFLIYQTPCSAMSIVTLLKTINTKTDEVIFFAL